MWTARKALSLAFALATLVTISAQGQEAKRGPLRLVQTIPMPNVKGRIDHMDVDVKRRRLFVSGLENGSEEVIDLGSGKWLRSLSGFKKPQGVVYAAGVNKLFVASGDDGLLRVFGGNALEPLDSIKLDSGPNRITYDPRAKLAYVGYDGKDGGKTYGEIAIVDARSDRHIGDIRVDSHPAEIALDTTGQRLYVLLPRVDKVQVIDIATERVVTSWPLSSQRPGDADLEPTLHRLFIGTHTPPQMVVIDTRTGKEISSLATVEGMDGVAYDMRHKRIYVSGGRGFDTGAVYIYQLEDADHYKDLGQVATRPGAGTSFWSPELNRYYVAAPAHDDTEAAILVYEPEP